MSPVNPPSIDKRLVALTQQTERPRQQTPQTRLMRSKSVLFLTAGILLLTVLIAVGH